MDKIIKKTLQKNILSNIKKTKRTKKIIFNYTKLFLECGFELDFLKKKKK